MIIAGKRKDLVSVVYNQSGVLLNDTNLGGTMLCVVRLESYVDGYDGTYWHSDGYWDTVPVNSPTASHLESGMWYYRLPADATNGKSGDIVHYTFTDDLSEPTATTVTGGGEHQVVEALSVWEESLSGHNTTGTTGEKLNDVAEPADVAVYESEPVST